MPPPKAVFLTLLTGLGFFPFFLSACHSTFPPAAGIKGTFADAQKFYDRGESEKAEKVP